MKNQLTLDMRVEEGRAQVSIDLDSLSRAERIFLFGLLQHATKNKPVGFAVEEGDNDSRVLCFEFANPMAPTLAAKIHTSLVN